jgi:hypothetical protein
MTSGIYLYLKKILIVYNRFKSIIIVNFLNQRLQLRLDYFYFEFIVNYDYDYITLIANRN